MKTTVTDKLTRTYLQKLDQHNYLATVFAGVIVVISLFWMIFHIGGDNTVTLFSDSMYAIADLIGASFILTTLYRARNGPIRLAGKHQLAWLLIACGMLADSLGGWSFAYLEQIGQPNPTPSFPDIGFTLFYPLVFIGLLLIPTALRFRVRTALDTMITTLCILGISWFFFNGPAFQQYPDLHFAIVPLSYPFWDMLLIFAIVLLILRKVELVLQPSLIICGLGILALVWGDTIYAYQTAFDFYTTGTPYIDTFWFIGPLMIGLSALYQYTSLANKAYSGQIQSHLAVTTHTQTTPKVQKRYHRQHRRNSILRTSFLYFQSALIYLPLIFLSALLLYSDFQANEAISKFLVILTIGVGVLITLRYLFATHENETLLEERKQQHEESELTHNLMTELTDILDFDRFLDRIVTIIPSELGFDAAMLILIDDYNRPLDALSRLIVRTATSHTSEIQRWQLLGGHISRCTILSGHELSITWAEKTLELPPEVDAWRHKFGISTTHFIPLLYQGKIQGCIGFASIAQHQLNNHDLALAKTYTQQIAAVLEHAQLYKIKVEQEHFAKAMANIAARLNAAVVEPTEIYQLICEEGASALRANYALLYINDGNRQLVPLALSTNPDEPLATLNDWPCIPLREQTQQLLTLLQPILLEVKQPPTMINGKGQTGSLSASIRPTTRPLPAISQTSKHRALAVSNGNNGSPTAALEGKLAQHAVPTAILTPLIAGGDPLGLLVLARSLSPGTGEKRPFTTAEIPQVQDFAEQAAVAFTNAQLYQRQRAAHEQLKELDQLKDQFMITASHELRTPLTAVQGYIELLAQYDDALGVDQKREFLEKARRSCDELVIMLENVMDASQLDMEGGVQTTHLERVPLQHLVDSIMNLIEPTLAQEKREVYLNIPAGLAVQADARQLSQVLLNLSANALKYSPPTTPLAFSASVIRDQQPRSVVISIADKGKGISAQDQARLFQRFLRLEGDINSSVRGSGLGLYISRRLIEAMGGKIWVESKGIPGEGSTFHIQLAMA